MNITLNPELEQLINSQLATGNYNSVEDLMRYAKILNPDSSKPQTLYLTTMEIAIFRGP